ncbi:hypothetical protein C0995_015433 [Termitomyces sp. Mi166|nr:hypothetical protein C0995_015433 [Termitomyces sp. Mi166\
MTDPNVVFYGFTPVPRDPDVLFDGHPTASGDHPKQDNYRVTDFPLPDSQVVREVKAFVQTYYLACLLHDIGTAERFLATTKLSFEFKGAIVARDLILKAGGVEDQADSWKYHHDRTNPPTGDDSGWVLNCQIDQLLQIHLMFLPRVADNVGIRANLLHPALIETTCAAYPRNGWSECFAQTIERELTLKPWCHTSTFEVPNWKEGITSNFASDVRGNNVMRPYD